MMRMMGWSLGHGLVLLVEEGEEEAGRQEGRSQSSKRGLGWNQFKRKTGQVIRKRF